MKKIRRARAVITTGLLMGLLASLFMYGGFLDRHPFDSSQTYMVNGANTKILYVGGIGNNNYSSIQDALDNASNGDTIFVYNGTYRENLVIDVSLTLRGEDKNTTIIEGRGNGYAVGVGNGMRVDIRGFTIKNGFTITNGTLYDGGDGIVLQLSRYSHIEDNIIMNTHSAIKIAYSDYNTIIGNRITNNYEGVIFRLDSNNNTLADNIITSNVDEGIYLWNACNYNTISNNTLTHNGNYGIYFDRSSNNTFCYNHIATSQYGLYFYYPTTQNNTVTHNTFQDNNYSLCFFQKPQYNTIYLNNFISNNHSYRIDSQEEISNLWYSSQPIYYAGQNGDTLRNHMGNYWDDYTGNDNDNNGLGDSPYTVTGDLGDDMYPLIMQWEQYFPQGNMRPLCTLKASPLSGPIPLTVTFTLNATDVDGTITSWALDINLDGTPEYSGTGQPSATQNHTYSSIGTYTASLTVTDNNNSTDTGFLTITVTGPSNNPPTCTLAVNVTSGYAPHVATFIITTNDTDGTIASWALDIDNDTHVDYSGTGTPPPTVSHTYNTSGIYTVKLTVTDNQGATASSTVLITVMKKYNQVPHADFTYSPTHPTDLDSISFTNQSFDTDGIIIAYNWDFGDSYCSTLANPQHTYTDDGTYLVYLTVTDNDGSQKTINKALTILNVGPQADAILSTSPPFTTSTKVEFMDNSTDPDGAIVNSTWAFGDESIAYGTHVNHTYAEEGIYNVTLTVTDDDGGTDLVILVITIEKEDTNGGTPGFELVPLCGIIMLLLIIKKKKR